MNAEIFPHSPRHHYLKSLFLAVLLAGVYPLLYVYIDGLCNLAELTVLANVHGFGRETILLVTILQNVSDIACVLLMSLPLLLLPGLLERPPPWIGILFGVLVVAQFPLFYEISIFGQAAFLKGMLFIALCGFFYSRGMNKTCRVQ